MSANPISTGARIAAAAGLTLTLWLAAAAAGGATITYRRTFPGSVPEFIEISVSEDGAARADIRQAAEEPAPQEFRVGPAVRASIFALARELNNFRDADLDVRRRIANLGRKTFRYEGNGEVYETQFNYTTHPAAGRLQRIFEGLAQQQQDLADLERALRYDRLGVNDALRRFETNLSNGILPEPHHLLPVLDRIAADTRVIDVARQRARSLAENIRATQAQ